MIRQAISCDICGTEKKQTNHWFVATDQGGELRISGWSSRNRLRPGSKHLCGQTCLHMLVDEFIAHELAARPVASKEQPAVAIASKAQEPKPSAQSYPFEEESSARLISTPEPTPQPKPLCPPPVELRPLPGRSTHEEQDLEDLDEAPTYASRNWRVEAWKRERDRQAHSSAERHPLVAVRRRSIS